MKQKKLTDYQDYVQQQSSRSGMLLNSNTVIRDVQLANISLADNSFILDIGCRAGAFSVFDFMKHGYQNVYGIDIGFDAETYWKNFPLLLDTKLKRADIHDGIPFEHAWNFITISHTLEHCYDPSKVVSIMYDSLAEHGYIHSIVPMEASYEHFELHKPHMTMFETHEEHQKFYSDRGLNIVYQALNGVNSILIAKK
jgi:SAM-dependent methyltransferase